MKALKFLWEVAKMVIISLAIILPVRYFLIQPFYVKGASMEPNFHNHEYLIIDEISYRFNEPNRGDVIVFRYPFDPQEFYIKRVIGLPGESIQIKNGDIYIYSNDNDKEGVKLNEEYLYANLKTVSNTESRIKIGENEYYVLGDNRIASSDSRSFGPVDKSFVIGKVFFRGWPFSKIEVFNTTEYSFN